MKYIMFLFFLLYSFPECTADYTAPVIRAPQLGKTQLQHKEIVQYFDDYMQNYNDHLSDANNDHALQKMANTYHLPAIQLIPGIPARMVKSTKNIAIGSRAFFDRLIKQGVSSIEWEKVNIELLTDKTAYASNVGIRYNEKGGVISKAAADFFLIKTNVGWKNALLALHSVDIYNNQKLKNEVLDFFGVYLKNYNDSFDDDSYDTKIMSSLMEAAKDLTIPSISITQGGSFKLFDTRQSIIENTQGFVITLKNKGATRLSYDKIQIKMLNEFTAIASNIATINRVDGTSILKLGVTYVLTKTVTGWKIIYRTTHTPENILKIGA